MKNYIKDYLKNRPAFYVFIRPKEIKLFRNYLPFKRPVLDFGCGDGFFAKVAFKDFGKIDVGLDVDKKKLKEAKKEKTHERLIFYSGDKIPFPNNYFSTVISNCVLEHIQNLDESLEEIYRILKPGGTFLCTAMTDKWEKYLLGNLFFGKTYSEWMKYKQKHFNLLSLDNWKCKFEMHKFKVINIIGYLDEKESKLIDLLHYLSIGSLINYKLFKKWIIFPKMYDMLPINLINLKFKKVSKFKSASLYFVLQK